MAEKKETKKTTAKAKAPKVAVEEPVVKADIVEEAKTEEVKQEVKTEEEPKTVEEAIEAVDTTIKAPENEELYKKRWKKLQPIKKNLKRL